MVLAWWCKILKALLVPLGIGAFLWGCEGRQWPPREGTVERVVDGDTIILTGGGKVRYLGIDAPEMPKDGQPEEFLASEAKEENARLVYNQTLRLEFDLERYDQYGRLLAYLFLPDGKMVNAELVRRGLARVYLIPPNLHYQTALVDCQRQAIQKHQGLWNIPPPSEESIYICNPKAWRFHRPDCPAAKKITSANRLSLPNPLEAYLRGYSRCRNCKP
jgi:micrococcal nuclease